MHLYVHFFIGVLMIVLAIPLILRKVPMNHVYGVRIRRAFASERNWYDINAYGGKLLLVYGIVLGVYGVAARRFAPDAKSIWSLVYVVAPLLLVVPMIMMIMRYSSTLRD